jgi:hypothetical protein
MIYLASIGNIEAFGKIDVEGSAGWVGKCRQQYKPLHPKFRKVGVKSSNGRSLSAFAPMNELFR